MKEREPLLVAARGSSTELETEGKRKSSDGRVSIDQVLDAIGPGRFQWRLLLMCGLVFTSDAIQSTQMTFLPAAIRLNSKGLTSAEQILLTSAIFAGEVGGALIFGIVADLIGRRKTVLILLAWLLFFALSTCFIPTFSLAVASRFGIGCGVGGLSVPFDLLSEYSPGTQRGKATLAIEYFWSTGSVFVVLVAWGIFPPLKENDDAWRYFAGVCTAPLVIAALMFGVIPESPRWLLREGKLEEAARELENAARYNRVDLRRFHSSSSFLDESGNSSINQSLPRLRLLPLQEVGEHVGVLESVCRLVNTWKRLRLSMSLWLIWFLGMITYYGLVLKLQDIISTTPSTSAPSPGPMSFAPTMSPTNSAIDFDYSGLLVASLGETLGVTLAIAIVDRSRKLLNVSSFAIYAVCVFILMWHKDIMHSIVIILALIARAAVLAGTSGVWVVTPELYTSANRATAHSVANCISRFGGLLAPVVSDVLEFNVAMLVLAGSGLVCVLISMVLPETAGKVID